MRSDQSSLQENPFVIRESYMTKKEAKRYYLNLLKKLPLDQLAAQRRPPDTLVTSWWCMVNSEREILVMEPHTGPGKWPYQIRR